MEKGEPIKVVFQESKQKRPLSGTSVIRMMRQKACQGHPTNTSKISWQLMDMGKLGSSGK